MGNRLKDVNIICMSTRQYSFALNEFYHLYNRGNSKQVIFKDQYDYQHFIQLLFISNGTKRYVFRDASAEGLFEFERGESLVAIGAYCLMPNHFHLLLTPLIEGGVSKFIQKMATGYSMYFNAKYERTGSLYESKFKSRYVDSDEYLKYLFAYIHLNPVKLIDLTWKEEGIKDPTAAYEYAKNYQYSSLPDYLGIVRKEGDILTPKSFPDYFTSHNDIKNELLEWLQYLDTHQ